MGLSASVAPGSASWRHMASIIGCRNRCPSWRTITPMTWLDSSLVVEATPARAVTSFAASALPPFSFLWPQAEGVCVVGGELPGPVEEVVDDLELVVGVGR